MEDESSEVRYCCGQCPESFTSRSLRHKHSLSHTKDKDKRFSCTKCKCKFKYEFSFLNHVRLHDDKVHKCVKCGLKFTSKDSLQVHDLVHKQVKYACTKCDIKPFSNKASLDKHVESRHNRVHKCLECGRVFKWKHILIKHVLAHKKIPCTMCNRKFEHESALASHMETHNNHKHKCLECGQVFKLKKDLKQHAASEHTHTQVETFPCTKCDRKFGRKWSLYQHMKVHKEVHSNVCLHCGKLFLFKGDMENHAVIHKNSEVDEEFRCLHCFQQEAAEFKPSISTLQALVKN